MLSFVHKYGGLQSAENLVALVSQLGFIPFFEGAIPGFSVQALCDPVHWFDNEGADLGPWDWKVDVVGSGEVAYGKFLYGGKAAFATHSWYRRIASYRRSLDKYIPRGFDREVYDEVLRRHSAYSSELRRALGVKKSRIDTSLMHLMQGTRLVIGTIDRVYRGPDLHYDGWQRAVVCTPDELFGMEDDREEDFESIFGLSGRPSPPGALRGGFSAGTAAASGAASSNLFCGRLFPSGALRGGFSADTAAASGTASSDSFRGRPYGSASCYHRGGNSGEIWPSSSRSENIRENATPGPLAARPSTLESGNNSDASARDALAALEEHVRILFPDVTLRQLDALLR